MAEHHVICKQLQFYFFFLIWIIYLIWLLWLGLPKQCWINVAGMDILSCSWSQRKCFQFFTFENDVCCGFVIYDFYYVEVGSLCALFLERFYHKRLFNFVKSLPCIHWNYHMNFILHFVNMVYQFSSVAQSCLTLCDPIGCSTPGFPVHHQTLELAQTHVHWVSDAVQQSHPLLSPSPAFSLSQNQRLFQWVSSLYQVAKVLELQLQHQSFQCIFRVDFLRIDLFAFLAVQGTLKNLLQHHS